MSVMSTPGAHGRPRPAVVRVAALYVASARSAPMEPVLRVRAEAGTGLVGDRYHGSRHRHVSVQSLEQLDEAAARRGAPIPAELTRRNVTLDHGPVPDEPGDRILIGTALLEVVRRAAPCRVMEESIGAGARTALRGRGGTICRVLTSGVIEVGDVVCFPLPDSF